MAIDYFAQQFGEDVYENTAPAAPAFSNADINAFVQANIGNPQAIADAAQQYGVSAEQLSQATGYDANTVSNYFGNAGINFGQPAQTYTQTNEQGTPIYEQPYQPPIPPVAPTYYEPPPEPIYEPVYQPPQPPVYQPPGVPPPQTPVTQKPVDTGGTGFDRPIGIEAPTPITAPEDPNAVQRRIIEEERKRNLEGGLASLNAGAGRSGGSPKPVDLGNGTFRTSGGTIIDSQGYPVVTPDEAYKIYTQARLNATKDAQALLSFTGPREAATQASMNQANALQAKAGADALAKIGYSVDANGEMVKGTRPAATTPVTTTPVTTATTPVTTATTVTQKPVDTGGTGFSGVLNATPTTAATTTVTQATTPAPVTPPPPALPAYFLANPDVAAAYANNSYGLTPEQYANTHYANYGQYEQRVSTTGAPAVIKPPPSRNDVIQNYVSDVLGNTGLTQFEKVNNIMETAQKNNVSVEELQKLYGKDIVNNYLKDYGSGIKSFITSTLGDKTKSEFDKVAEINQAAKKYGLDSAEIAQYSGLNKKGVDQMFTAFDSGLASLAKGWDTAKTTAGTDTAALSAAEANKAKTMLALQGKYQVSDDDLAKAMGSTAKDVSSYLAPVKEAPKTLEALMSDTKMTATEIRAKIEELKSNPAVNGIYSAALEKFSDKASKDYSGEYGGKKFESLNPIAVSNVFDQLKAQQAAGTAKYYQGGAKDGKKGGFGSLDSMTEDMAKNLVAAGITDIRQVGEVPVYEPVKEIGKTYNGQRVLQVTDEDSGATRDVIRQLDGGVDQDNNPTFKNVDVPKDAKLTPVYGQFVGGDDEYAAVDSSKITKDKNGKMVAQTGTTAGNKATGEPLSKASNYSERTTGSSWSGTFKGKGNTGYNVQFKDGNPIFYTTGASSSDMVDLAPILAIASFIPGVAPFAQAINALYAASEGNWKQALLSALPVGGEIAKTLGASANTVANIGTASKFANVANAIDNKDILGLVMSGTGLASDKNLFGEGAFNPSANVVGNFSTKDLLSGVSIAKAIENKDLTSLANIGAQLSGSKDAVTAAKGLSLIKALESKNPMAAIAQIATQLNLNKDVIGKAGGGLASLPGLIKNGGKDTLTDKNAFDGLNGSLVAKMLNQQPPAIRAAMLKKMTQTA